MKTTAALLIIGLAITAGLACLVARWGGRAMAYI